MLLNEWNRTLIKKSKELLQNDYYTVDTAMNKVWDINYDSITCDDEVEIKELRFLFWSTGHDELDIFNNKIIEKYGE